MAAVPNSDTQSPSTGDRSHVRAFARIKPDSAYGIEHSGSETGSPLVFGSWAVRAPPSSKQSTVGDTSGEVSIHAAKGGSGYKFTDVLFPTLDNDAVFARCVPPVLGSFLEGRNACFLFYGQTGSGKTYTCFGEGGTAPEGESSLNLEADSQPIPVRRKVEGLLPLTLTNLFRSLHQRRHSHRSRVAISYYEIYCEQINDLLEPAGRNLKIEGSVVKDLTVRICDDLASAMRLIEFGTANKSIGNSYIHDKSSRAHTVFAIHLASELRAKKAVATQLSRLCFVDLAGSEALSYEFGATQQQETKSINLSLLSLRQVVDSLVAKESFVPYRSSKLTRILAPCLSVNSVTTIICTIDAAVEHETLSTGTLRFGSVSRSIEQRAVVNEFLRAEAESTSVKWKKNAVETVVDVEEMSKSRNKSTLGSTLEGEGIAKEPARQIVVSTRLGPVSCWYVAPPASLGKPKHFALCLHGYGNDCSGADWIGTMEQLRDKGQYACIAPDFPGFGQSKGTRGTSRTERFSDEGSPIDLVIDVLEYLVSNDRSKKVSLVAWDWGANMALFLALSAYRHRLQTLALYHPSWTTKLELLQSVTQPTLLCWEPSDQLHLFSTGKRMARLISKSKLISLVLKPGKSQLWGSLWNLVESSIVEWLLQHQQKSSPLLVKPTIATKKEEQESRSPSMKEEPDEMESSDDGEDSDDDSGSLSTQSSFLACLLLDPNAAAQLNETKQPTLPAPSTSKAHPRVPPSIELLKNVSSLSTEDSLSPLAHPSSSITACQVATQQFGRICRSELWDLRAYQDALLRRNGQGGNRPIALRIAGNLPLILPHSPLEPFRDSGVFSGVQSEESYRLASRFVQDFLASTPLYPSNRRVLVKVSAVAGKVDNLFSSSTFGFLKPLPLTADESKRFTTSRPSLVLSFAGRIDPSSTSSLCRVRLPVATDSSTSCASSILTYTTIDVPWRQVFEWNEGTVFPPGPNGDTSLQFEDAIICRYHDAITRSKVSEMAIAVDPIFAKMINCFADCGAEGVKGGLSDILSPLGQRFAKLQIEAIRALWSCVDMIHHVQMGKDPSRLCVPDCGRLATYGQWHCHGMASVFAALLLPFTKVLGLVVRYRDGFFLSNADRDTVGCGWNGEPRPSADHTWLEITFLPSGLCFVCDPSFANDEGILVPVDLAYSFRGRRFPTRNLTSALPCVAPSRPVGLDRSTDAAQPQATFDGPEYSTRRTFRDTNLSILESELLR